jgi:hypothetical protein
MLIARYSSSPCPSCQNVGGYGNINITNDWLNRGCTKCKFRHSIPLPKLSKKVIYLDQFFLSHAFRNKERRFVDAVTRIHHLADKQLIVCPRSSLHELETHLWRHEDQASLWRFIKRTSRGHEFEQPHYIKVAQIRRAFERFCSAESVKQEIDRYDALKRDVDSWEDYLSIDVGTFKPDMEKVREEKAEAASNLVDLFEEWRRSEKTFEQDTMEEAQGYARFLLKLYFQSRDLIAKEAYMDWLHSHIDGQIVGDLLRRNREMPYTDRMKRIMEFFSSMHFVKIPNIDISCQIFALMRKYVRSGRYQNKEKAKGKLAGIGYDIDAISLFAPYCEAIFIDREMEQWLKDPALDFRKHYTFRVFSVNSFENFLLYLSEIENNGPNLDSYIQMVHGDEQCGGGISTPWNPGDTIRN